MHLRTKLLSAALAVAALVAATPAGAGPPIELPALTRIASKLSGLQSRARIRVVNETAAGMQRQAERLLDRDYPPDEQAYDEIAKHVPIGRAGKPEEIAATVLWLCSPGASYVVGHALTVDGGMTVV